MTNTTTYPAQIVEETEDRILVKTEADTFALRYWNVPERFTAGDRVTLVVETFASTGKIAAAYVAR